MQGISYVAERHGVASSPPCKDPIRTVLLEERIRFPSSASDFCRTQLVDGFRSSSQLMSWLASHQRTKFVKFFLPGDMPEHIMPRLEHQDGP